MYFDIAVNIHGNGARVMIIHPNRKQYPILSKLQLECTNNMVDYKACILEL